MKARNDGNNQRVESKQNSAGAERIGVDFTTLILSFHQVALYALNVAPHDEDRPRDLPAAKMQIDMLQLLQQKTEGNLDDNEKKLLENVLYELRMAYVDARRCE